MSCVLNTVLLVCATGVAAAAPRSEIKYMPGHTKRNDHFSPLPQDYVKVRFFHSQ